MKIETLSKAIRLLTDAGTKGCEMHISMIQAFLHIAAAPGSTVSDLAKRTGVSASTMTRAIHGLHEGVAGKPGLGLVDVVASSADWRVKEVSLSEKGRAVVKRLEGIT